jgi:DNA invertase Pin-like site-specific DNA recombinase
VLAVAKRDRVARDVVVAAMVDRAAEAVGARVVSADGTGNGDSPADAFMRSILDAASAYERGLIRARTRAALAAKRARGEKLGGRAPYGQRVGEDGRTLVAEEGEQAVISTVRALAARGLSQRGIAAQLAARGVVGRTGAPLAQPQIQRILAA